MPCIPRIPGSWKLHVPLAFPGRKPSGKADAIFWVCATTCKDHQEVRINETIEDTRATEPYIVLDAAMVGKKVILGEESAGKTGDWVKYRENNNRDIGFM